jgi:hypothetical protein
MSVLNHRQVVQIVSAVVALCGFYIGGASMALAQTHTIEVVIVKDGRVVRSGASVRIAAGREEVVAEKRQGRLFVRTDGFGQRKSAHLQIRLKGEIINAHVESRFFRATRWTVTLADDKYSQDYQWAVPEGTDVRQSCFVAFEFTSGDGPFTFHPKCRSNRSP